MEVEAAERSTRFVPGTRENMSGLARGFASLANAARVTPRLLQKSRCAESKLVMLTAYDYPSAQHAERAGVDVVLVGDSVGMVVHGRATTQPVTLADMLHHTQAARRGVQRALLVADLPFGSYETSSVDAMRTAYELVKKGGADAVKLEGGSVTRASAVRAIVDGGIAVMGHVGLTPQTVSVEGGFRATGRDAQSAKRVLDEALAIQDAGAFALVLECLPEEVAKLITGALEIPTIGIGAGKYCDGQVLVYHDMLGVLAHPHHAKVAPKFSKQYAQLGTIVDEAIREYAEDVRGGSFPSTQYSPYRITEDHLDAFRAYAESVASGSTQAERTARGRADHDERLDLDGALYGGHRN